MDKIYELEQKVVTERKKQRIFELLSGYEGEDRVVRVEELLTELAQDKSPRAIFNTDIPTLDNLIGGFRPGQLVIISAPTGQGKTSFCQTLTSQFTKAGNKCLWFTYEVGIEEFMEKMPDVHTFFLPRVLKQNSIRWLEERIVESLVKHDTKIVFVDHLHYLLEMQKMAEAKSISLLIGMLLRELKRITIQYGIVLFLVSHIRKLETIQKKPELDDLRDSSFVAQESDIVIMMNRIMINDPGAPDGKVATNETNIFIRKNRRTGNLGAFKVQYLNHEFRELATGYEDIK